MKKQAIRQSLLVILVGMMGSWSSVWAAEEAQSLGEVQSEEAQSNERPAQEETPPAPQAESPQAETASTSQSQQIPPAQETAAPSSEPSSQPAPSEPASSASAAAETPTPATSEGLISIDFKDADIRQVLRIVSLKSGVDIVASPTVEGQVTIKLTNVPWEQALDIILRTYSFTYERKGSVIRVLTLDAVEQEALATEVFPLDYATAKEVTDVVTEMLSERGKVKYDGRTNTIIVTDIPSNLFQLKDVIDRLDQRTPQVRIETRIVETKLEREENLGINWSDSLSVAQSASTFGSSFPFAADATLGTLGNSFLASPVPKSTSITLGTLTGPAFTWTINALKKRTNTRIISNPTLAVLTNQQAKIQIGIDFPVPKYTVDSTTGATTLSGFDTKSTGTILTVTPRVNPAKEIVVDLKPEVISVLSNASFTVGQGNNTISLPRFSTQTVQTQVRIQDGQTIAIGGLVKNSEVVEKDGVPLLSDIPILGHLFKAQHKFGGGTDPMLQQDLLIFLTVTLLDESPQPKTLAARPSEQP